MPILQGGPQMSVNQFKNWIKSMDTNGDGHISKKELEEALRGLGFRFAGWRASRAIAHVDIDSNGVVNGDMEMEDLIKYAKKRWGMSII